MKFVSWNVNGLRACIKKGFFGFLRRGGRRLFHGTGTKLQPHQIDVDLPGYAQFFHSAEKSGYSGTAVFCKNAPRNISYDFGIPAFDGEGRVITWMRRISIW